MASTQLARRTLVAGIAVGVVGLLGMLLTAQILNGLYNNASLPNEGYYLLNTAISGLISFCLPFSAALIAASLVMRHAESLTNRDRDVQRDAEADFH